MVFICIADALDDSSGFLSHVIGLFATRALQRVCIGIKRQYCARNVVLNEAQSFTTCCVVHVNMGLLTEDCAQ